MNQPKCGIVIGHYNQPDFLELNIAAIRHHCGDVPILVSDDCSDGFGRTPQTGTLFWDVLAVTQRFKHVHIWPNPSRIGHTGGDMSAIWKAIIWGHHLEMDVVFKLSQRCIIDKHEWHREAVEILMKSDCCLLGKPCAVHRWAVRTESIGLKIAEWYRWDILAHLTPREIAWPVEQVLWDDMRDRLGERMVPWPILSDARPHQAPCVLFREANAPEDFRRLAFSLGVCRSAQFDCRRAEDMPNYWKG